MLLPTKPRIAKEGRGYVCRNVTFDHYRPVPIVGFGPSPADAFLDWLIRSFDRVLNIPEYEL